MVVLTAGAIWYDVSSQVDVSDPLTADSNVTVVGLRAAHVHQVNDVVYDVVNNSSRTIQFDHIDMKRGIGGRIRLVRSAVLVGESFYATTGWPPRYSGSTQTYNVVRLRRYRLTPHGHASLVAGFVATAPGTYAVGPAVVFGRVDIGNGVVPRLRSNEFRHESTQSAFLCVDVRERECDAGERHAQKVSGS